MDAGQGLAGSRLGGAEEGVEPAMMRQPGGHHSISAWRDYDQTVIALTDSMSLGTWELTAEPQVSADDLFAAGARQVTFHEVVSVNGTDARDVVTALTLVRDLTGCGIVVDWKLQVGTGHDWRELSHLYPPTSVTSDAAARDGGACDEDPQADWVSGYVMTKCVTRRGPELLQVRDRRWGNLRNITIAKPDYLAAVARLEYGAPADEIPAKILSEFRAARLVGFAGGIAWWLPYRLRRWAVAPRVI